MHAKHGEDPKSHMEYDPDLWLVSHVCGIAMKIVPHQYLKCNIYLANMGRQEILVVLSVENGMRVAT